MFAPWCVDCGSRVLLGPRRIISLERGPDGPRAVLRCHCGSLIVWSSTAETERTDHPRPTPDRPSQTDPGVVPVG